MNRRKAFAHASVVHTVDSAVLGGERKRDGVVVAGGLFAWQQLLIRYRTREGCFRAFLNNNWVGAAVFMGILLDYLLA